MRRQSNLKQGRKNSLPKLQFKFEQNDARDGITKLEFYV